MWTLFAEMMMNIYETEHNNIVKTWFCFINVKILVMKLYLIYKCIYTSFGFALST